MLSKRIPEQSGAPTSQPTKFNGMLKRNQERLVQPLVIAVKSTVWTAETANVAPAEEENVPSIEEAFCRLIPSISTLRRSNLAYPVYTHTH